MTRLLRKQVPLAALLAAEAGDALPMALQERIAAAFADWLKEMPREASGPVLKDLVLTDFVTRVVSACRGPLADPRAEVRARLVWGLGELGSAEAAGDLVAALSDADKEVRLAAEKAFEAVPVESPMTELAATLVDPRPEVRASAIKVLALLGVKLPLDELRGYLEDPNEGVRAAAVSAYKGRGREEALAAMDVVMKDASSEVRKELADELLVSVIGDVSPDVRAVAVSVLGRSDEGVTVCLDALKDSALDVRLAAAKMLASRKRREALGPLLDVFRERADKRYLAAKALGALGAEEAIEPLLAYVEDEGNEDRYSMIEAIGQLASSRHVERLENLLRGLPKPSAPADLVFAALWAIAEREARSLPGV
jgi:HEAT repeat protein